ncbi:MAG: TetR/AcrR family transcriptional regulator [Kineosporiaceae bacterium]|nr:TetR/AcrR family transcriptional regulator [Aeromicrobium sp.]
MTTKRPYTMTARKEAADGTRLRILQATFELWFEMRSVEIVLADIAERAAVSPQSVLRHFGSKEGLFDATFAFAELHVDEERETPVGDVERAVDVIMSHYETRGDAVLRLLAQEFWDDHAHRITDNGRRMHRQWVEAVFAPQLGARSLEGRETLTDLLLIATDVYTWKLLRRDRALSRAETTRRILHLVRAVLTE